MKFGRISVVAITVNIMLACALVSAARGQTTASSPAVPAAASAPASVPASAAAAPAAPIVEVPAVAGRSQWGQAKGPGFEKRYIGALEGRLDTASKYLFQVEVVTQGSAIYTVKLADYFATVKDKQLYEKLGSQQKYEQALREKDGALGGHFSLLNPVGGRDKTYLPMETRAIRVTLPDGKGTPEWQLDQVTWQIEPPPASMPADTQEISLSWTLFRDPNFNNAAQPAAPQKFLRLVKTYTIKQDDYSIGVQLTVENLSSMDLKVAIDQAGPTGVPEEQHQRTDSRMIVVGKLGPDNKVLTFLRPTHDAMKMTLDKDDPVGFSNEQHATMWLGQVSKYFGSILYVRSDVEGWIAAPQYKAEFAIDAVQESPTSRTYATVVKFPEINVAAHKSASLNFDLYAGPKDRDIFQGQPPYGKAEYDKLHYIGTIDLTGGCTYCTFDWLTFGMMWLLQFFYSTVAFHNYGVAIILLVVLTRLVLHPLTKKGQVSMSRMQKMGPAMAKIKEKYANDKEGLNREMMKMYKQQGATPILGCLPMLLQMPIWIALWTALNNDVALRHAAFLPVWITDLAAPDALFSWDKVIELPMIGALYSFNLLPILLTIATILQTKLTPQMGQAATPEAAKQQKMMMYMMPFMMLLIFYPAPSGLTLYIMSSTFAGVAEQYVIRKHIRERDAMEAASETIIDSGKSSRFSRGKKPKGPGWTKH